jgi:hypothetical protein
VCREFSAGALPENPKLTALEETPLATIHRSALLLRKEVSADYSSDARCTKLHSSAHTPMTASENFAPSIRRGLRFLYDNQLPYGEFRTYASPSIDMRVTFFESSIFVTTFVLYSIARIDQLRVAMMTKKALSFLTEEMCGPGLFQFFTSKNVRSIDFDLDCTACASVPLQRSHPLILGGYNIRQFIENRNEAGLFYTWVGDAVMANDLDSVVNANVVFYLGDRDETKSACRYLVDTIKSGHESDSYHYYLDDMTLYYAVSRAYAHGTSSLSGAREAVIEKVLQSSKDDGSFGNELATACAVCTLANFEYDDVTRLRDAARYLERRQRADGSWRRVAMWVAMLHQLGALYYGSEELTTALCLEALTHIAAR